MADPDVVADAWRASRDEVEIATRFVAAAASVDVTGDDPLNQHGSGGRAMSLRQVLVTLIEECARHLGHVDLLRGGSTGVLVSERSVRCPTTFPISRAASGTLTMVMAGDVVLGRAGSRCPLRMASRMDAGEAAVEE